MLSQVKLAVSPEKDEKKIRSGQVSAHPEWTDASLRPHAGRVVPLCATVYTHTSVNLLGFITAPLRKLDNISLLTVSGGKGHSCGMELRSGLRNVACHFNGPLQSRCYVCWPYVGAGRVSKRTDQYTQRAAARFRCCRPGLSGSNDASATPERATGVSNTPASAQRKGESPSHLKGRCL